MTTKNIILLLLCFHLFSCGISNRKNVAGIIAEFRGEKTIDPRETIFAIEPVFENGKLVLSGETSDKALKTELFELLNNFNFTDKVTVLPDSTVGNRNFGLINLSVANLRTAPRHSAELSTQALLSTPVKILKLKGSWYQIQTPDKYISWVDGAGIQPITQKQFDKWKQSKRIIYMADNGSVYKTNSFKLPVSDVTMGNILQESGRNNYSIEVRFPDGRTGFTKPDNWMDFKKFKNSTTPNPARIKRMAEQLNGRPYLWGGTSVRAMDCSGFVKTLYFMNGLILPRDASQQARYGETVDTTSDLRNLHTGDLLFFGKKATGKSAERITHVALSLGGTEYINEAGRMIRNSFDPTSNIFSEYRKSTFLRAKRVIGSTDAIGVLKIKNHSWY